MDFFAFVGLAAVAMALLVLVSVTRAMFDRKKREQDKLERYKDRDLG